MRIGKSHEFRLQGQGSPHPRISSKLSFRRTTLYRDHRPPTIARDPLCQPSKPLAPPLRVHGASASPSRTIGPGCSLSLPRCWRSGWWCSCSRGRTCSSTRPNIGRGLESSTSAISPSPRSLPGSSGFRPTSAATPNGACARHRQFSTPSPLCSCFSPGVRCTVIASASGRRWCSPHCRRRRSPRW